MKSEDSLLCVQEPVTGTDSDTGGSILVCWRLHVRMLLLALRNLLDVQEDVTFCLWKSNLQKEFICLHFRTWWKINGSGCHRHQYVACLWVYEVTLVCSACHHSSLCQEGNIWSSKVIPRETGMCLVWWMLKTTELIRFETSVLVKMNIAFPCVMTLDSLHLVIMKKDAVLTFWRRIFFLILAHPVFKVWVIQKPNKVALWNKRHFEEEKMEIVQHV